MKIRDIINEIDSVKKLAEEYIITVNGANFGNADIITDAYIEGFTKALEYANKFNNKRKKK